MWKLSGFLLLTLVTAANAAESVDFDTALQMAQFDIKADANGESGGNGLVDSDELALLAEVVNRPDIELGAKGGASHRIIKRIFDARLEKTRAALTTLNDRWPSAQIVITGYSLLDTRSHVRISEMVSSYGVVLPKLDPQEARLSSWFAADGDADGDGIKNRDEYQATKDAGRSAYLQAALNPNFKPAKLRSASEPSASNRKLRVGIVIYPGFEALDVYGPLEMWAYVPNFEVLLISETLKPVKSAQQVATLPTHTFKTAPSLDILMVPGGMGTFQQLNNPLLIKFIQQSNRTTQFTASVCTGSALLAKAGVLDGQRATTNKRFFFLSEQQSKAIDWVPAARWVESGKYFTSSGVSAGIDMALGLVAKIHGQEQAAELASQLEYQWHTDASQDVFADKIQRLIPQASGPGMLVKTYPVADAHLSTAPRALTIAFNKAPDVLRSQIILKDAEGKLIGLKGQHTMGDNDLMIMVKEPLKPGRYSVEWRAAFNDKKIPNDTISGDFTFHVGK